MQKRWQLTSFKVVPNNELDLSLSSKAGPARQLGPLY